MADKITFEANEASLYKFLQEQAQREEDGLPFDPALSKSIQGAMKPGKVYTKTTPSLMPVDAKGNPVSIEDVNRLLEIYADNIEDLIRNLAYIADPEGYKWGIVSGLQTSVAGAPNKNVIEGGGLYKTYLDMTAKDKVIQISKSSIAKPESLAAEAIKIITDYIITQTQGFSYSPKGTRWAVNFIDSSREIGSIDHKYVVTALLKARDREVNRSKSPEDFNFETILTAGYTPRKVSKPLNIEHGLADVAAPAKVFVKRAKAFREKVKNYLDSIKNTSSPEELKVASRIISNLDASLRDMDIELRALQQITRMVGEELPDASNEEIRAFYRDLVREGKDLGFHVVYRDKATNNLAVREVKVDAILEAKLKSGKLYFPGRAAANIFKSAIETAFKDNLPKLFVRRRSASASTALFLQVIKDIFEDTKGKKSKYIKRTSQKKEEQKFIKLSTGKKIKTKKVTRKKSTRPNRPKGFHGVTTGTRKPTTLQTTDLLALLNQDIEEAVVKSMIPPALINRTRGFASSVKILGLSEQQSSILISYYYKKDPYRIFSTAQGKSPWNSPRQRDPESIIQNALIQLTKLYGIGVGKRLILKEGF